MRIAYIGNFRAPNSTENDLTWTLNKLGHQVYMMQEDGWSTDEIRLRCEDVGIELVLYTHTHGWHTPGSMTLDQLWEWLKNKDIPTVSFHLDYWRGLPREVDVGNHPFWRTKYVFTADGGSNDWYREKGINHFWLRPGVVERDCYFADFQQQFKHDVIFVGSKNYHPEWSYRPQLVNWLQDTYQERFALYGNDGIRSIRGHELNELYRSAKVVVGDTLCLGFNHPNYWSDRIYETMGRGGFLIHPRIQGLEPELKDREHLAYYQYGDFGQLRDLIDYYLANYYERELIRLQGHKQVKENCTYTDRMTEMLNVIKDQEAKNGKEVQA